MGAILLVTFTAASRTAALTGEPASPAVGPVFTASLPLSELRRLFNLFRRLWSYRPFLVTP